MESQKHSNLLKLICGIIIAFGAAVKLKTFLESRDLFIDELNLSRNLIDLPYHQLFGNLQFNQHAPPFFAMLVKSMGGLLGVSEISLRLTPFLVSLLSLYLFYQLCLMLIKDWAMIFSLMLFSWSIYMLEYAVSVKQYSTDVFFSLLFVYWALKTSLDSRSESFLFCTAGAIALWFSMPLIFILAAIGIYFLVRSFNRNEFQKELPKLLIIGFIWLLSFGFLYLINIKTSLNSEHLLSYHQRDFIPFPDSWEDLQKFKDLMVSVFRSIVGKTTLPIVFAMFLFVLAFAKYFADRDEQLIVLACPIILVTIASVFGVYAFAVRLSLFFLPLVILMMGKGLSLSLQFAKEQPKLQQQIILFILIGLSLLCLPQKNSLAYLAKPFIQVQSKSLILEFAENRIANEPIIISHNAVPCFDFYTRLHKKPIIIDREHISFAKWETNYKSLAESFKDSGFDKLWLLDSHSYGMDKVHVDQQRDEIGSILIKLEDINSNLYYLELH